MAGNAQKQPGNRVGIGRVHAGHRSGCDFAAVIVFPGWAGVVPSNGGPLLIVQRRFWRLQSPGECAVGALTADVNLKSRCMRLENKLSVSGRLDLAGHFRMWIHVVILALATSR